jgi:hypothetical protein
MKDISGGVVHELPDDLGMRLAADARVLLEDIAPLARNEWICWTTAVKLVETKNEHAGRVPSEQKEGMRRPRC